jgi:uncharacterized protein (DUF1684 family)
MHSRSAILLLATLLPGLFACNRSNPLIEDEEAYASSIEEWRHDRLERLKARDGWLNLAGLLWLEEGENRFGSDPANDIVFPEKADPFCGTLTLEDGKVTLEVAEGVELTSKGVQVSNMVLNDDHSGDPTKLEQGDLGWNIIRRGERYAIRLRDFKNPRIEALDHMPSYPVNTDYVVEATLVPFEEPWTLIVATPVEGFTESYLCPGELHFRIGRQDLVLYPFASGEGYFLVFADETNGLETYGSGRFMYAEPDSAARTILDFNKAYNPPCAFSPYATCPMPPRENFLEAAIEAGEKAVHLE